MDEIDVHKMCGGGKTTNAVWLCPDIDDVSDCDAWNRDY